MGKNLISQKRGKGSSTYRALSFRYAGAAAHPRFRAELREGIIKALVHSAGHYAPLARIIFADREEALVIAPEGVRVGDSIAVGPDAEVKPGNTLSLAQIPEGTPVFNIENTPGDGGRFVRSSGGFARVVSRRGAVVQVMLPSKKEKSFNASCRATVGIVAGGGRKEKPLIKAGIAHHKMRARNKLYPSVSGTSMNSVNHPFGGSSSSSKGRPTIARRYAPAGAKVGMLSPRRSGRKKR